ncbi:MAG: hypothetical protein KAT69_09885 [Candidatus Aminicenantes bacterium]|nr:hypothetical protein [Candidatus Aminicenantes bacterium]
MIPKIEGLILFILGGAAGALFAVGLAYLKINGLRKTIDLKDSRIRILQGQADEKDAIIKGFVEKEKEDKSE